MKRYIRSSTSISGWWDRYYDVEPLSDVARECGLTEEELLQDEDEKLQHYSGVEFACYLTAKPEYQEALDYLSMAALYKDDDVYFVGYTYGSDSRLNSVSEDEVEDMVAKYAGGDV